MSTALRRSQLLRKTLNLPSHKVFNWQDWITQGEGDFEVSLDPEIPDVLFPLPRTSESQVHWQFIRHQKVDVQRTFVASIYDGYLLGPSAGSFLNRHGDLLWDLGKEHWLYYNNFYSSTVVHLPKPRHIQGTVAVLSHPVANSNYGHWLFDVLPKLGLLERAGFTPDKVDYYVVDYCRLKFQLETLEVSGIPPDKIISFEKKTHIRASQMLLPFLSTYQDQVHQPSTIEYVRRLSGVDNAPQNGERLLFISRQDASFRRLIQEREVCSALEKLGFECITLAGLGLAETAHLFSQAKMVVGPTGSGLMNVAFCPSSAKVVEIVGPTYFTCHHWYLASECGLQHHYFMGKGSPIPEGGPLVGLTNDIDVDTESLVKYITTLIDS